MIPQRCIIQDFKDKKRTSNEPSIVISSPEHGDIQSVEILMHAHSSGQWHKAGLKVNTYTKMLKINKMEKI